MQPDSSLAARHPATAARMASVLCFVAAGTTAILPLLGSAPAGSATQVVTYAVPLVLLVLGLTLPRVRGWLLHALLLLTPLAGIAVIAALDVTTNDATAAGQVFLCFPVLLAASQLRAAAAALVTLAAVTADAIVVFTLQTPTQALTDFVFVSTTLVMIAGLLTTAGIRQDRLVAQLQQQAAIDPLTGLVTRRVLDDALLPDDENRRRHPDGF